MPIIGTRHGTKGETNPTCFPRTVVLGRQQQEREPKARSDFELGILEHDAFGYSFLVKGWMLDAGEGEDRRRHTKLPDGKLVLGSR